MRPVLAIVGLCLLVLPVASQGPAAFVPVSVWYGGDDVRPPLTPRDPAAARDRWRAHLQAIRSLGFNSVRTWVAWADAEPVAGQYKFEALDQMLALAREAGLRVIVQLFTDEAPAWIRERHSDAGEVTADGRMTGRACSDHPGVREDVRAFVEAVSARAAGQASFHALDVSDGTGVEGGASGPEAVCVCRHTQQRFREWLQRRYGSIEGLNAAWRRSFTTWTQLEPPRDRRKASYADHIDWAAFNTSAAQEWLQFKASASAPRGAHAVISHSPFPSILADPARQPRTPDDWWTGGAVDAHGTAIFPAPAGAPTWSAAELTSALDGIRSAAGDRGWWLAALQSGQAAEATLTGPVVGADDIRLWTWAALSRGARSLGYYAWFPMRTGADARSYGLVEMDGTLTERARAAGEIAGIITRNPALFAPLRPRRASVAIVHNPLSAFAGGGDAAFRAAASDAQLGTYRALFERNIAVDFLHADEIAAGRAASYRLVWLPRPLLMPRAVADALKAYVRGGGTLISDARPALVNERGEAEGRIPGLGLDEVFGAREKEVRSAGTSAMTMERELDGPLSSLAGRTIRAQEVSSHLEITGTSVRVLARFPGYGAAPGDPALVLSRFGTGRAILAGSFLGASYGYDDGSEAGRLIGALAELAGARPEVRIGGGGGSVETRFLESSTATVLIAINHGDRPQKVTMTFASDTPEAIWLNLETGASVNFVAGPEGPTYTYAFRPRDVLVLMIQKQWR